MPNIVLKNCPTIKLLEKWRQSLDYCMIFQGLLPDISKAFDCVSLSLLLSHCPLLSLLHKIGNTCSSLRDIFLGVAHGSI